MDVLKNIPKNPRSKEKLKLCFTEFCNAVDEGNEEVINALILKKDILQKHFGFKRDTMLHVVARKGQVATAIKMIQHGADVNIAAQFRETPIFHALCNSIEMVKCLLDNGAEVNALNNKGEIPLHQAVRRQNLEIVRLLLNKGANVNSKKQRIYIALRRIRCLFIIKDPPKYYGITPLHEACRVGNMEIFKILLEFGASKKTLDEEKNSLLHFTMISNCLEIAKYLLEDGFDVNKKNTYGYTPLLFAVHNRSFSLEMLEILIQHGANINAKAKGYTIVHIVSYLEQFHLMDVLRELHADFKPTRNLKTEVMLHDIFKYTSYYTGDLTYTVPFLAMKDNDVKNVNSYFLVHYNDEDDEDDKEVSNYFEICLKELSTMKSTDFEKTTIPVYNFLISNIYTAVQYAKNKNIRQVLNSGKYKKTFPCYAFFLEKRFIRIKDIEKSVDQTEAFFNNYGQYKLPSVIIRMILSNLRWIDFKIMGKILSPEKK